MQLFSFQPHPKEKFRASSKDDLRVYNGTKIRNSKAYMREHGTCNTKVKSLVEIDASVKFEFLSEIDCHGPVMDPQRNRPITSQLET